MSLEPLQIPLDFHPVPTRFASARESCCTKVPLSVPCRTRSGQLGRSWGKLGRTWGQLGRTWGQLGCSWSQLRRSLGPTWTCKNHQKCSTVVKFRGFPLVSALSDVLGPTWALLGLTSTLLGPTWTLLGPTWSLLGANMDALGANLDALGANLDDLAANLDVQKPSKV